MTIAQNCEINCFAIERESITSRQQNQSYRVSISVNDGIAFVLHVHFAGSNVTGIIHCKIRESSRCCHDGAYAMAALVSAPLGILLLEFINVCID